jgi:hypothetical protein
MLQQILTLHSSDHFVTFECLGNNNKMPEKGVTKNVENKPVKWKKYVDDESNTPYYYNEVSGESRWEIPEDYESVVESEEEEVVDTPKSNAQWTKHIDDETGSVYYYDEVSKKTQWGKPEDFIETGIILLCCSIDTHHTNRVR